MLSKFEYVRTCWVQRYYFNLTFKKFVRNTILKMQAGKLPILLLLSSALLFSIVRSEPNHNHDHNNERYTSESTVELLDSPGKETHPIAQNERYTSESTEELLDSGSSPGKETPTIAQNDTEFKKMTSNGSDGIGLVIGYIVAGPVVSVLFLLCCGFGLYKCCRACRKDGRQNGFVMLQSTTLQPLPQPAPETQIILQQPIIHQQAPPPYDLSQKWTQSPPQSGPPPQGTQYAPHPMGQQQHYSPNSGYDNAGFNPATAPPPYNTGKY